MPGPVPPWLHRVQFIAFYAFNPCDAEMSLYVEMAKAPVGRLAAFILIPSVNEIVENFFQPRGLRSKRHGRKGRKGGKKGVPIIPDVDDMVARRLPGYEAVMGRPIGSGTRWVINGINQVDRVVFPLVLVDQVTNTLFDTIIGVIESDKAVCPNYARMLRTSPGDLTTGLFAWTTTNVFQLKYAHNVDSPNGFVAGIGEGTFSVTFSMTVTLFHGVPADVGIRLISTSGIDQIIDQDGLREIPPFTPIDFLCSAKVKGPEIIRWEWFVESGTLTSTDVSVLILRIGD
jgi:hypothetical protein